MNEQPAEIQIGYRLDCMARELDELRLMAANPETADLIEANIAGVKRVFDLCKTIAAHLVVKQRVAA